MAGLATPQTKSALLNAFPLESSAMCNKKAVLCTAFFVISVHCFVQARQCTATTKATHKSGFLVAHCARDSGGIRTHDPQLRRLLLYPAELRNQHLCHCRGLHSERAQECGLHSLKIGAATLSGAKLYKIYLSAKFFSQLTAKILSQNIIITVAAIATINDTVSCAADENG